VASVRATLERSAPDYTILVVDDSSPDGTGELADRLAEADPHIHVLHRQRKSGLGPAYVAGFRHALAAGAELVVEMDADFSHDPIHLPALIGAAREADLVLGSRYVNGGAVSDWGPMRRFISRGGCWYARHVLNVEVHDLTGGFKCFRRSVLEALDLDEVRAHGYAFQVELTYRALQLGFHVEEIPIVFHDRRAGRSKMGAPIVLEGVLAVPRLRRSVSRRRRASRAAPYRGRAARSRAHGALSRRWPSK
jgi:dolichol-phosphate mannosyltransferase